MPLYYFDLHECGVVTRDEEGREFADVVGAKAAAVTAARDVMAGELLSGKLCLSCNISISDESREEVANVWFRDAVVLTGVETARA